MDVRQRLEALEVAFAAIAHASRRQILLTVHIRGQMSAGDIAKRFAYAWPTISRHLRILEDAGLLTHEKQGTSRYYRVNHERLRLARDWFGWFEEDAGAEGTPEE